MNDANRTRETRVTLLALLCLLAVPALAQAQHACSVATWIEPGEVVRGLGRAAGEPDCYRLATPGAGLLMLDVAVPAGAAEPLLTVSDGGCGLGKSLNLGALAATPSRRLVRIPEAREFLVCVGAQDPLLRLDDFRLETAFLPVRKDEPIEVEPDGLGTTACRWRDKDEPIEVEPDGFGTTTGRWQDKDEPIEVEPDGLALEPGVLAALCRETRRDEHADLFACATRLELGRAVAGEIDNLMGDDQDAFAFELTVPGTVSIWLSGESEAALGLYESRGQRLALTTGTEAGSSALRRVKTLGPGVYFVRVQGWQGAEGAYELEVALLPRSW